MMKNGSEKSFGAELCEQAYFEQIGGEQIYQKYVKKDAQLICSQNNKEAEIGQDQTYKIRISKCKLTSGCEQTQRKIEEVMENLVFVTNIISQKLNVDDESVYIHEEQLSIYQADKSQIQDFKNPVISKVVLQQNEINFEAIIDYFSRPIIKFIKQRILKKYQQTTIENKHFYTFLNEKTQVLHKTSDTKNIYWTQEFELSSHLLTHSKIYPYSPLQRIGVTGGMIYLLYVIISCFLSPFYSHSSILDSLQHLYLIRSSDPKFKSENKRPLHRYENDQIKNEINNKHHYIQLNCCDWINLFLCQRCSKYNQVIQKGKQKMKQEMDLINLTLQVREHRVILENSLLKNEKRKTYVKHTFHNLIDVDDSMDSDDDFNSDKYIDSNQKTYNSTNQPLNSSSISDFEFKNGEFEGGNSLSDKNSDNSKMWYFCSDRKLSQIKFFEHEIDKSLRQAIMYKKLNFIDYHQDSIIQQLDMFTTPSKIYQENTQHEKLRNILIDQENSSVLKTIDTHTIDSNIKKPPLAPVQSKQIAKSDQYEIVKVKLDEYREQNQKNRSFQAIFNNYKENKKQSQVSNNLVQLELNLKTNVPRLSLSSLDESSESPQQILETSFNPSDSENCPTVLETFRSSQNRNDPPLIAKGLIQQSLNESDLIVSEIQLEEIISSISSSENNSHQVTYRSFEEINKTAGLRPNESNLIKDKRMLSSQELKINHKQKEMNNYNSMMNSMQKKRTSNIINNNLSKLDVSKNQGKKYQPTEGEDKFNKYNKFEIKFQ